jgi:Leucine-rich repeat (LRR) protein
MSLRHRPLENVAEERVLLPQQQSVVPPGMMMIPPMFAQDRNGDVVPSSMLQQQQQQQHAYHYKDFSDMGMATGTPWSFVQPPGEILVEEGQENDGLSTVTGTVYTAPRPPSTILIQDGDENHDNMSTVTPAFYTLEENDPPYEILFQDGRPVISMVTTPTNNGGTKSLSVSQSGQVMNKQLPAHDVEASSTQQPSDTDSAKDDPNNNGINSKECANDIEAQKQVKGSAKVALYRQRRVQLGAVALLVLIGGAVGGALAFSGGGGASGGSSSSSENNSADDSPPSPTQSPGPSPALSQSPSSAPTVFDVESFLDRLVPEYSQTLAQTVGSPQEKALSWLKSDPVVEDYSNFKALQRFALATLFYATEGADWVNNTGWLDFNQTECDWYSSAEEGPCSDAGQITYLSLLDNGMAGTLPDELAILTDLLDIHFENAGISGTIPTRYGLLTNLSTLRLRGLPLSGSIPKELAEISNMDLLLLSANDLGGSIPTELGKLTLLTAMLASSNLLSGSLPTELGECTQLDLLSFRTNNLTGKLPTELGRLTLLTGVSLYENLFSGEIPSELGLLENVQFMFLDENDLTGQIPSELGKLTGLVELWVNGNRLSGSVPEEVCNMVLNNGLEIVVDCDLVECDCGCLCATA